MSSTNRGAVRSERDFYETPAPTTSLILPQLDWHGVTSVIDPCAGRGAILDVVGRYKPSVACFGIELDELRAKLCTDALVLRNQAQCLQRDALDAAPWPIQQGNIVIMNPPFSLAFEFCDRAIREVGPGGTVVALMRLSVMAPKIHRAFWFDHPADAYVLEKRPSFAKVISWDVVIGKGKATKRVEGPFLSPDAAGPALTSLCKDKRFKNENLRLRRRVTSNDSSDYAFFVWGPGRGGRWTRLPGPGVNAVAERARCAGIAAWVEREAIDEDHHTVDDVATTQANTAATIRRRILNGDTKQIYVTSDLVLPCQTLA